MAKNQLETYGVVDQDSGLEDGYIDDADVGETREERRR